MEWGIETWSLAPKAEGLTRLSYEKKLGGGYSWGLEPELTVRTVVLTVNTIPLFFHCSNFL